MKTALQLPAQTCASVCVCVCSAYCASASVCVRVCVCSAHCASASVCMYLRVHAVLTVQVRLPPLIIFLHAFSTQPQLMPASQSQHPQAEQTCACCSRLSGPVLVIAGQASLCLLQQAEQT